VVAVDVEVDVADFAAVEAALQTAEPDAIYHLAAFSHVGESWKDPTEVLRVNVLGTATVLAAARQLHSAPAVLIVSSSEVYGRVEPGDLPIVETTALRPASPYAASKAAAEQFARQAFLGYDQPVITVRPFNHVGPGQAPSFAVSAMAKRIVEAQRVGAGTIPVGNLSPRRDYTDVRDVVRAYRQLIIEGVMGETYNVCSGEDVSIEEVANQLCELAGASLAFERDPDLVREVDLPVLRGSAKRLNAATGWAPQIRFDETLRDVLTYWREQLA
jgi:GDP-4-dehydro-6-deoxy-D-mannose reductase